LPDSPQAFVPSTSPLPDGTVVIRPETIRFFEVPVEGPLPEDLNYIP